MATYHVCKYGRHLISETPTAEYARKKESEETKKKEELECGPMPNVMAALPNIGAALCSTPQSLADAHY